MSARADSPALLHVPSVEDSVHAALRDEILHLGLSPGARLRLELLARHYGVSQTPVRLALIRLEGEGLVQMLPRRGARVATLELPELEEVQAIRTGVEGWLARHGAPRVTDEDLETMAARLGEIDRAHGHGDLDGYLASHWRLRDVCYRAAGRSRLLAVAEEQRRRAERYLRFLCSSVEALAESREHQARLLEACRKRDGNEAEAATRAALLWTLERLAPMLDAGRRTERSGGDG